MEMKWRHELDKFEIGTLQVALEYLQAHLQDVEGGTYPLYFPEDENYARLTALGNIMKSLNNATYLTLLVD